MFLNRFIGRTIHSTGIHSPSFVSPFSSSTTSSSSVVLRSSLASYIYSYGKPTDLHVPATYTPSVSLHRSLYILSNNYASVRTYGTRVPFPRHHQRFVPTSTAHRGLTVFTSFRFASSSSPVSSVTDTRKSSSRTKTEVRKSPHPTTKEKGKQLEDRIVRLLRMKGEKYIRQNVLARDKNNHLSEFDIVYGGIYGSKYLRKYIECKNYDNPVPLDDVAKFKSVLQLHSIPLARGLFITTNTYTPRATTIGIRTMNGTELDIWEKNIQRYYRIRQISKYILRILFILVTGIIVYLAYFRKIYTFLTSVSLSSPFDPRHKPSSPFDRTSPLVQYSYRHSELFSYGWDDAVRKYETSYSSLSSSSSLTLVWKDRIAPWFRHIGRMLASPSSLFRSSFPSLSSTNDGTDAHGILGGWQEEYSYRLGTYMGTIYAVVKSSLFSLG